MPKRRFTEEQVIAIPTLALPDLAGCAQAPADAFDAGPTRSVRTASHSPNLLEPIRPTPAISGGRLAQGQVFEDEVLAPEEQGA